MNRWLKSAGVILVLSLVSGCATGTKLSSRILHPVPERIQVLDLDRCWTQKPDFTCTKDRPAGKAMLFLTAPEEMGVVGAEVVISKMAWERLQAWLTRIIHAYCEGRETLQVANGQKPDPAPICKGQSP